MSFDVSAFRGRTFREDEFAAGSERVVVLSYGLWTRRFGSTSMLAKAKSISIDFPRPTPPHR